LWLFDKLRGSIVSESNACEVAMNKQEPADLLRFVTGPETCSYLSSETSRLEFRVPRQLHQADYSELVRRGWRRFGNYVFRPQCPVCRACRSLRVVVAEFRPSRSLRRVLNKNSDVRMEIGRPAVSEERISLFNSWLAEMTRQRGWADSTTNARDYYENFIGRDFEFAYEIRYLAGDRLAGVSLVDVATSGVSCVYFYHDPRWRPRAPGTFSILQEIEWARRLKLPYVYLGYWIEQNQSMNYKSRFRPHELLLSYVDDDREPSWTASSGS